MSFQNQNYDFFLCLGRIDGWFFFSLPGYPAFFLSPLVGRIPVPVLGVEYRVISRIGT
jgi:hypothetical protein